MSPQPQNRVRIKEEVKAWDNKNVVKIKSPALTQRERVKLRG